jgi:hypothetical protein
MNRAAFLFFCFVATTSACATGVLTARQVAIEIKAHGAREAIATLAANDQWDTVTAHIVNGETEWIALAPQLASGSDAGSAEDLGIALAYALPKQPAAVLRVIDPANGPVTGTDRVCGMPFIEDSVEDLPAYRRQARAALEAITDPTLQKAKQGCIAALEKVHVDG